MYKSIIMAAVAALTLCVRAENRIYKGNYVSGLAKWTVKAGNQNVKLYGGNYASGLAKWTTAESSGLLKIYSGNYASGLAKFCYKGDKLYSGNYASGLAKWTTKTTSDGLFKIYSGNYASGLAKYTMKGNKLYAGNYASGLAKWSFSATTEIPEGLLVFLATQILVEESGAGTGSSPSTTGSVPHPSYDPVIIIPPSTEPAPISEPDISPPSDPIVEPDDPQPSDPVVEPEDPQPSDPVVEPEDPQPSDPVVEPEDPHPSIPIVIKPPKSDHPPSTVDLSCWEKARTLKGVKEVNGELMAIVEVKCGKMDRRGQVSISATVTPLVGRKRTYRANKIRLAPQETQTISWVGLRLDIKGNQVSGTETKDTQGDIRSAVVGGQLPNGSYHFTSVCTVRPPAVKGYIVLEDQLSTECVFTVSGRKWTFPKNDPAMIRLTYVPKTGLFKGTFKVLQSNEGLTSKRVRTKKTSVKVNGFIVDGEGVGKATAKQPVLDFDVTIRR